jgi:glutathione S-transferase
MFTVYGMRASGNCYKIELALRQLDLPYRWVEVDIFAGASRTPEFLARNPNGRVPLLQLPGGEYLAESNAILCYLADGSALMPGDRLARALALQWMFFEQYSHEPYVAVARFIARFLPADHPRRAELPRLRQRGDEALAVLDGRLAGRDFVLDSGYSVADIALYAYTHSAADGGFELSRHPNIQAWLARVAATPGFIPQTC